jgi:hypothetical protein
MLVMRLDQMSTLADEGLADRLVDHLKLHHSKYVEGEERRGLREVVRQQLNRARAYDLTWESALTGFVALTFVLGPRFDQHPQVQAILTDSGIEANDRLHMLVASLSRSDWEDVRRFCRPPHNHEQ